MSWFIFTEVMFFAGFFGALYYLRVLSVPWLGDLEHKLLWPEFTAGWPSAGPGATETFTPMGAWGLPAFNTALLLTSGVTCTWAHWALKLNKRSQLKWGLFLTIALGALFIGCQAYEYVHAYSELNLKLTSGAYGASFFMLTGFHGFHVTLGAIMLTVIYFRVLAATSNLNIILVLKGYPGIGTLWMWSGWVCLYLFIYYRNKLASHIELVYCLAGRIPK